MNRKFLNDSELIKKLEKRAKITFSKLTIELFKKVGYKRIKNVLIYISENKLIVTNRSIVAIYKNEKHLRYMLMPRVESFEITLKRSTLHEVTRIVGNGADVFSNTLQQTIFIKGKKTNLIKKLEASLKKVYLNNNFKIKNENIFDWMHKIMLGDLILFISALRPNIVNSIFKKGFRININSKLIKSELNKIRELRNKIAHAEQLFSVKKSYFNHKQSNKKNYAEVIIWNIDNSMLKDVINPVKKYLNDFMIIFNKYKM